MYEPLSPSAAFSPLGSEVFVGTQTGLAEHLHRLPYDVEIDKYINDSLRDQADGVSVHIGEIVRTVTGCGRTENRLPEETFTQFFETFCKDPRVRKLGKGFYMLQQVAAPVSDDTSSESFTTQEPVPEPMTSEKVLVLDSLDAMIKAWKGSAPRAKYKPPSRRRVHFKKGTNMSEPIESI